jgi:hypothetical protein
MQVICMRDILQQTTPSIDEVEAKLAAAIAAELATDISDSVATCSTLPY